MLAKEKQCGCLELEAETLFLVFESQTVLLVPFLLLSDNLRRNRPILLLSRTPPFRSRSDCPILPVMIEEGEKSLMTKQELFNKIVTLAGGRAAEEIVFGSITTGASNDIEQMTKMARAMITRYGMSDAFDMMQIETQTNKYLGGDTSMNVSAGMAEQVDREVLDIIKKAHEKAAALLSENIDKLHELSRFLLVEETITGAEFMEIVGE